MGNAGSPTHALILCTRHRPDEVVGCLVSVAAQTLVPPVVVVVDSSDDTGTETAVAQLRPSWSVGCELRYLHTTPSLSHQRVVGLAATASDIVHFVDDDVRLSPEYFDEIMAEFERDAAQAIMGVGGYMVGQPKRRVKLFDVLVGLDSEIEGVVLSSGRNIPVVTEPTHPVDVQWLTGAAMSYRRDALVREPPDVLGFPFEGEDVDLSLRVGSLGRLVITPNARYEHRESQLNRVAGAEQAKAELRARLARVAMHPEMLSRRRAFVAAVAQCAKYAVSGIVTASPRRLAIAKGTAQGLLRREQA